MYQLFDMNIMVLAAQELKKVAHFLHRKNHEIIAAHNLDTGHQTEVTIEEMNIAYKTLSQLIKIGMAMRQRKHDFVINPQHAKNEDFIGDAS